MIVYVWIYNETVEFIFFSENKLAAFSSFGLGIWENVVYF